MQLQSGQLIPITIIMQFNISQLKLNEFERKQKVKQHLRKDILRKKFHA
jgi:hypothetical protein